MCDLRCAEKNIAGQNANSASHIYGDMKAAWGIALKKRHGCVTEIAVACNGSNAVLRLDPCGAAHRGSIYLSQGLNLGTPTGVVYYCGDGFVVGAAGVTAPARLIMADNNGVNNNLWGYSEAVNQTYAVLSPVQNVSGDITALALHDDYLYAALSEEFTINKYDSGWNLVAQFSNPVYSSLTNSINLTSLAVVEWRGCKRLAATYSAFNFVTLAGPGQGWVDLFDFEGNVTPFISMGQLNAPGPVFSIRVGDDNYIGVGNVGDGKVNLFDERGRFAGTLNSQSGNSLTFGNLFAIAPDPEKAVLYLTMGGYAAPNLLTKLTVTN